MRPGLIAAGSVIAIAAAAAAIVLTSAEPIPAKSIDLTVETRMQRTAENYIRLAGYNCPRAKRAIVEGERPRGLTFRIECGADDLTLAVVPALSYFLITDGPNAGAVTIAR